MILKNLFQRAKEWPYENQPSQTASSDRIGPRFGSRIARKREIATVTSKRITQTIATLFLVC